MSPECPPVSPVDLSSWRARLERAEQRPDEEEEEEEPPGGDEEEEEDEEGAAAPPRQWERYRHGVLTLGCVGEGGAGGRGQRGCGQGWSHRVWSFGVGLEWVWSLQGWGQGGGA